MAGRPDKVFMSPESTLAGGTPIVPDITSHGGEAGFLHNIAGYVSNAQYVKPNVIAIVMATPRGFDYLPNSEDWHRALKSVIETHSRTIGGIDSSVTVEYSEQQVDGAGGMQAEMINVTRANSAPSHTFMEKNGKIITKLFDGWIYNLIGDPLNNVPRVLTYSENGDGNEIPDMLPDMQSMTTLYIEPDVTNRFALDAWLVTDMKPRAGAPRQGSKEITGAKQNLEISIEFTGLQQVGATIVQLATRILNDLSLGSVNADFMPAFISERSADVNADASRTGYAEDVANAASSWTS